MAESICATEGCGRPVTAVGLCSACYMHAWRVRRGIVVTRRARHTELAPGQRRDMDREDLEARVAQLRNNLARDEDALRCPGGVATHVALRQSVARLRAMVAEAEEQLHGPVAAGT